jgi:hypothetical protein
MLMGKIIQNPRKDMRRFDFSETGGNRPKLKSEAGNKLIRGEI